MSFKVRTIPPFERQLKKLAKKYVSIKNDVKELGKELEKNPVNGEPLGNNCFKIRLSITSKGKGKSAGARVITCVLYVEKEIYLLSIYDKSEQGSISNESIKKLIGFISR